MDTRFESRDGWIEVVHADIHVLAKGDAHLRDRLRSALAEAGDDDPTDVITDALAADGVRRTPAFAIVDEPGRRVLVRGSARVLVTGADGEVREFIAPPRAPWSDEDLSSASSAVVLMSGEPTPVAVEPEAESAPAATPESAPEVTPHESALAATPGSAAGDEIEPEPGPEPAVAEEPEPEPVSEPVTPGGRPQFVDGHLVSMRLGAAVGVASVGVDESEEPQPEPQFEPGPVFQPEPEPLHRTGMLPTSDDVPSAAPAAAAAPVAAEPLAPASEAAAETVEDTTGPGHLLMPTGETIELDRPVRLGRAPRLIPDDAGTEPHLVRVASPDNEVSRNHAEVRRIGERVLVRDLGSTNGTVVALPGESGDRLLPGEQRRIDPGTTVTLAGRVAIVYEGD